LLPVTSGSPDWAVKSHTYIWASEQTRQPIKTMLKYIVYELCVNVLGIFVVGNAASEAFPCLLKGTHFEDEIVLISSVAHTCKVKQAMCHPLEQAAWINVSVKALRLVVDRANPIRSEFVLVRDELVYIHPNKVQTEE
jgi:hypothetical protein